jgi:hypothetical protein
LLFQPPNVLLPVLAAALAVTAVLGALLSARPLLAAALALVAFLVMTLELILALEILIALIAAEMIGHKMSLLNCERCSSDHLTQPSLRECQALRRGHFRDVSEARKGLGSTLERPFVRCMAQCRPADLARRCS